MADETTESDISNSSLREWFIQDEDVLMETMENDTFGITSEFQCEVTTSPASSSKTKAMLAMKTKGWNVWTDQERILELERILKEVLNRETHPTEYCDD